MSGPVRLFVDDPLDAGAGVMPHPRQSHYLLNVMRLREGDEVALFNGRDGEWRAVIETVRRRTCKLRLEERLRPQQDEPGPALFFAPLRRGPVELLIEKGTELGATRFVPVITRNTVGAAGNPMRLRLIAAEAAEQCRRLTLPAIETARPLEELLAAWPVERPLYVGDETGAGSPALEALRAGGPGDVLIGPEGGFAPEELADLRSLPDVVGIDLGPRLLRAETAALCVLGLWQACFGTKER